MNDFRMTRLGLIMEPLAGDPNEVEGVLNPAAVRGPDGALYLFPRLVARDNYSRIGIARVIFDAAGDPVGVERLGIALEPEADYEFTETGGGCEDPRVVYLEPRREYVMTYTAFGRRGPRIAIAISEDLFHWQRVGLAQFRPYHGMAFEGVDDKDASVFPALIQDPLGRPALAMVHRPLFPGTRPEEKVKSSASTKPDSDHECMWISYCHVNPAGEPPRREFVAHHKLACPDAPWEHLKIGGGAPPILCRHGWLLLYHGVHGTPATATAKRDLCYSAGAMILDRIHPNRILYRSPEAVLTPAGPLEMEGTVSNVVFPTGVDRRDDLGQPDRFDVYYGMADCRIGVARLNVPVELPGKP